MVVVQAFTGREQREQADVRGGVVEILVADVMAETVDRDERTKTYVTA